MKPNPLDPNASPNEPSNSTGAARRLNKRPSLIIGGIVAVVLFGLFYSQYKQSTPKQGEGEEKASTIDNHKMAESLLAGIGEGITDARPPEDRITIIDNTQTYNVDTPAVPPPPPTSQQQNVDQEAQRIAQMVREFRQQNYYEAVVARTPSEDGVAAAQEQRTQSNNGAGGRSSMAQLLEQQGISSAGGTEGLEGLLAEQDPNLRVRKAEFAKTQGQYGYSTSIRTPQLTPYELRVGTIIPAVLVSGINSDLPGEIIGQVSYDVRDSKTGRYVLIPKGSKLIGRYDNHIAMGQKRVMIAWHRLQFPDASVFDLGNMGAVDPSGYAGMKDKVNNHSLEIFKNAFLLSIIGAGMQITTNNGNDNDDDNDPKNVVQTEIGRQFGQAGSDMIRRNLRIQPTLEIRPGYRFNVMVNKDLILQPYHAR